MRRDFGVSQWEEAWGFRDASIDAARFVPVSPHFFFHGPPFFTAPLDFELLLFRLVDVAALKLLPGSFSQPHPVFMGQKAGSLALPSVWSPPSPY